MLHNEEPVMFKVALFTLRVGNMHDLDLVSSGLWQRF